MDPKVRKSRNEDLKGTKMCLTTAMTMVDRALNPDGIHDMQYHDAWLCEEDIMDALVNIRCYLRKHNKKFKEERFAKAPPRSKGNRRPVKA